MAEYLNDTAAFVSYVRKLRRRREDEKKPSKRLPLTRSERAQILEKAGRRCHICGGAIDGAWHADHVRPHIGGGTSDLPNYLPAHAVCNTYKWFYVPEEIELILKLGGWARDQIEKQTTVGRALTAEYFKKERRRLAR